MQELAKNFVGYENEKFGEDQCVRMFYDNQQLMLIVM